MPLQDFGHSTCKVQYRRNPRII